MTLIVEDGSGLANAEAYISVADADTHHANRGMTNWATMSTNEKEQAIRRAADYMGQAYRLRWAGYRMTDAQALDWPRFEVPRADAGYSGYAYYANDVVPAEVVRANAELALRAAAGELTADLDAAVIEETVGPITVKYAQGDTKLKRYPVIDRMLNPLLAGGGGLRVVRA